MKNNIKVILTLSVFISIFLFVTQSVKAALVFPRIYVANVSTGVNTINSAPVYIKESLTGKNAYAYEVKLSVNPTYSKIVNVDFTNTLASQSGCMNAVNLGTNLKPGEVKFAVACTKPLSGVGNLANVYYKGIQTTPTTQYVTPSQLKFNETNVTGVKGIISVIQRD